MATYLPTATRNAMLMGGFSTATTWCWGLAGPTSPGTTGAHTVTNTSSHKRQKSKVTAAATGKTHNASAMTWTNMPAATIKYFTINTAQTGTGTYKGGGPTTATISVPAGSTVAAAIGAFTLSQTG